jgi:N-acetylmuramoyl-L-alanine amidase
MPSSFLRAGRARLFCLAGCVWLAGVGGIASGAVSQRVGSGQRGGSGLTPFDRAQRMREALEGRPEQQRNRRQYDRVLEAYRAIYHNAPGSPKADASIAAVADLLAEEGRVFQDEKALHDAIGQYDFLRRQYPASRFRFSALLTEGEIYERDLNDRDQAKAIYQQFLHLYPQHPLAAEARIELKNLHRQDVAGKHGQPAQKKFAPPEPAAQTAEASHPAPDTTHSRHSTVLTAAVNSQQNTAPARTPATGQPQHTQPRQSGMQENDIAPGSVAPAQAAPVRAAPPQSAPAQSASSAPAHMTDAELNAPPPPPRKGREPLVTGIRYWSTPVYTRVAIDLQDEVRYQAARVPGPDRIFFDLYGVRLSPELIGKSVQVTDDGFLTRIRAAQFSNDTSRIVLDVNNVSEYSAFFLPNPPRLIIDVHGGSAHGNKPAPPPLQTASNNQKPLPKPSSTASAAQPAPASPFPASHVPSVGIGPASTPVQQTASTANGSAPPPAVAAQRPAPRTTQRTSAPPVTTARAIPTVVVDDDDSDSLSDVASLGSQPNTVKATRHPTRGPVAASVAGTTRDTQASPQTSPTAPPTDTPDDTSVVARNTPPPAPSRSTRSPHAATSNAASSAPPFDAGATGIHAPEPLSSGQHTMMRALGLKINRIVIDAGHGGHDSGTLGPGGIEEKDVVLDVALRLGKLLKQRLGADVIYTRDDDTFIPLETRTAIANKAQADLFISVHANSSQDASARGVETYYLNFTNSADALEVAARENAVSDESIHQLSDLVKKIALQDKINESREFASDVEQNLYTGLESGNPGLKDRGVKKAPFVVLIGANMPSILAEISFLTNPDDAQQLRQPDYRERIAESLYRGVSKYVGSLNGVRVADNTQRGGGN